MATLAALPAIGECRVVNADRPSFVGKPAHPAGHRSKGRGSEGPGGLALPLVQPASLDDVALRRGVAVLDASRDALPTYFAEASLVFAACYPHRITEACLAACPGPVVNVHPSRLPRFRGPAPIFWQLWAGVRETGATLHRVVSAWDAGPIIAQSRRAVDAGLAESAISDALARDGASLFAGSFSGLIAGEAPTTAQNEAQADYQSWPSERDFRVASDWTAERVYRFVRGVAERGIPITYSPGDEPDIKIAEAIAWADRFDSATLSVGAERRLCFDGGEVDVRLAP
ncbi:MAG: formyltransferase family protein [Pseudomonadota bacterium]